LHGDIHRVRCTVCAAEYPCSEEYLCLLRQGTPPECPECSNRSEARVARSARSIRIGYLRPAIVLYEEPHPLGDEIGSICSTDLARKPDLLLVMGTSLKVHGIKKLVKDFCRVVHEHPGAGSPKNKSGGGKVLFINKTAPSAEWNGLIDYHIMGETDPWVERVIADWKKMRPADWEVQTTLFGGEEDPFKVVKHNSNIHKQTKAKKKQLDSENIPPAPSLGDVSSKISVPLSPSKRQRNADADEGSPRKKRATKPGAAKLPDKLLLFPHNIRST